MSHEHPTDLSFLDVYLSGLEFFIIIKWYSNEQTPEPESFTMKASVPLCYRLFDMPAGPLTWVPFPFLAWSIAHPWRHHIYHPLGVTSSLLQTTSCSFPWAPSLLSMPCYTHYRGIVRVVFVPH
jgi:hypothetical protein